MIDSSTIPGAHTEGTSFEVGTQLSDKILTGEYAIAGYVVAVLAVVICWLVFRTPGFALGGLLGACAVLAGNCKQAGSYSSRPALAPVRTRTRGQD